MNEGDELARRARQDADETLTTLRNGLSRAEVNAGVGQEHFAVEVKPRRRTGMGFSADTPDEKARARFEQVYGYPPAQVIRSGGCVWAGPIEEKP